jgi:hypothetical protein
MKFSFSVSVACLAMTLAPPLLANTEAQHASISRLGGLNGVALQCRYYDQTERIKIVLIANLPKRRELGLLFEHTTNNSFMSFMQQDRVCPGRAAFVSEVDKAVVRLESAYAK